MGGAAWAEAGAGRRKGGGVILYFFFFFRVLFVVVALLFYIWASILNPSEASHVTVVDGCSSSDLVTDKPRRGTFSCPGILQR